jgi:hypothetical protein
VLERNRQGARILCFQIVDKAISDNDATASWCWHSESGAEISGVDHFNGTLATKFRLRMAQIYLLRTACTRELTDHLKIENGRKESKFDI